MPFRAKSQIKKPEIKIISMDAVKNTVCPWSKIKFEKINNGKELKIKCVKLPCKKGEKGCQSSLIFFLAKCPIYLSDTLAPNLLFVLQIIIK